LFFGSSCQMVSAMADPTGNLSLFPSILFFFFPSHVSRLYDHGPLTIDDGEQDLHGRLSMVTGQWSIVSGRLSAIGGRSNLRDIPQGNSAKPLRVLLLFANCRLPIANFFLSFLFSVSLFLIRANPCNLWTLLCVLVPFVASIFLRWAAGAPLWALWLF